MRNMLKCGMEGITHAQNQPVCDCAVKDGEGRTSLPCREIYVAILSGPAIQNDFVGGGRLDQRRDCLPFGYPP